MKHFLDLLIQDETDNIVIKVNKTKYDPSVHDYHIIESYKIKQSMVRKKFKEKIILHLEEVDDILHIAEDTKEFRETYGYVVRILIHIKTKGSQEVSNLIL